MHSPGIPQQTYRHRQLPQRREPRNPVLPTARSQVSSRHPAGTSLLSRLAPKLTRNRLVNVDRLRDEENRSYESPALMNRARAYIARRGFVPPPQEVDESPLKARVTDPRLHVSIASQPPLERHPSRMYPQVEEENSDSERFNSPKTRESIASQRIRNHQWPRMPDRVDPEDSDIESEVTDYYMDDNDPFANYNPVLDNILDMPPQDDSESLPSFPPLDDASQSRFAKLASFQGREKGLRFLRSEDLDKSVSLTISRDNTAGEGARQASLLAHYGGKINSKNHLRYDSPSDNTAQLPNGGPTTVRG